jgi:hypothetical protein
MFLFFSPFLHIINKISSTHTFVTEEGKRKRKGGIKGGKRKKESKLFMLSLL